MVGRALSVDFAADGHEVVILSRNPERHAGSVPEGVRIERWDGLTAERWGVLADGAGAILNLAGESIAAGRWTAARKQRIRDSRIEALRVRNRSNRWG